MSDLFPTPTVSTEFFAPDDCELYCVDAPGVHRVLNVNLRIVNIGALPMLLGGGAPQRSQFECVPQPYASGHLDLELVSPDGQVQAAGETFVRTCAYNTIYGNCGMLGLGAGLYEDVLSTRGNSCQWLDVSGVVPGDYLLRVTFNRDRTIDESRYDNNQLEIAVEVPPIDPRLPCAPLTTPEVYTDCGWVEAVTEACVPQETLSWACPQCDGVPIVRVCSGEDACQYLGADRIADADATYRLDDGELAGSCASSFQCELVDECPTVRFTCPNNGTFTAMLAYRGEPGTCALVRQPATGVDAGGPP